MILAAQSIRALCKRKHRPMIVPFVERGVAEGRSYGLSGASYDVRIAQTIWVWPLWGRLASTIERFTMPPDVAGSVKNKSSNARRFIMVDNTWIDPGWSGYLTLEISRGLPWPVRIKKGTPIAQIVFEELNQWTELPYRGKYQNQADKPVPSLREVA